MTQVCRVCSHPDRKKIDREIISGANLSEIGRRYKLGKDSVWRHKERHISGALAAGARKSAENHGLRLLEDLDDLVITARRILRKAEEDGHPTTALKAIKEARASLVSIAQISHSMWQTQQKEQQTVIEVRQEEESLEYLRAGLKALTPDERKEYRRLNIKMLSAVGGQISDSEAEPDPDPSEGEKVQDLPLVRSENSEGDDPGGMEINPEDFSLNPRQVPRRRTAPVKQQRRTKPPQGKEKPIRRRRSAPRK